MKRQITKAILIYVVGLFAFPALIGAAAAVAGASTDGAQIASLMALGAWAIIAALMLGLFVADDAL